MRRWIVLSAIVLSLVATASWFMLPTLATYLDARSATTSPTNYQPREVENPDTKLPSAAEMERLASTDPIAFLEHCERKYKQTVSSGYSMKMQKQERISGALGSLEIIEVYFRDEPYSVFLHWQKGQKLAESALYVEGENKGMILIQPAGAFKLAGIQERDPEGSAAKQSGRFPITKFGLKVGLQRTRATWEAAREANDLKVEYLGQRKLKEA